MEAVIESYRIGVECIDCFVLKDFCRNIVAIIAVTLVADHPANVLIVRKSVQKA